MKLYKLTAYILTLSIALVCCFTVSASFSDLKGSVICLARDGDTANYPAGSVEGIESCEQMGVHMVSAGVKMTSDGVPMLMRNDSLNGYCVDENGENTNALVSETPYAVLSSYRLLYTDKTVSEYAPATVEDALTNDIILVLDDAWEYRDEIYEIAKQNNALERVILRTEAKAKEISDWYRQNPQMQVIGIYGGNIIFMAATYANALIDSGLQCVQFQSGNYFAVVFQNFIMKRFSAQGQARALAAAYDSTLCGKRNDTVGGWDDLISRGYSVIETNQPIILANYINELEKETAELAKRVGEAKNIDLSGFSAVSRAEVTQSVKLAEKTLSSCASKGEIEVACAKLSVAFNSLEPGNNADTLERRFSVTTGKLIAIVLGTLGVIAAQVYVHKRQKNNLNIL